MGWTKVYMNILLRRNTVRFWTPTFFIALALFFFIHTVVLASPAAAECPSVDSPQATALGYQLYTAYQVGFDGYQMPCELKCSSNKNCQSSCQTQQGLRLLQSKVHELNDKHPMLVTSKSCKVVAQVCLKQCPADNLQCLNACGLSPGTVASQ